MSENNYGENVVDNGYQMNEHPELAEDQRAMIPPLNVNTMQSENQTAQLSQGYHHQAN